MNNDMPNAIKRLGLPVLFVFCLLLAPALASNASRNHTPDPSWTFHTSFNDRPRRIIDTPDAVWLFCFQQPYFGPNSNGKATYNNGFVFVNGGLFRLDKANPEAGWQDMAKQVTFSGLDMRLLTVDPLNGDIAVAYEDGGIDLVTASGRTYYFDDLKDSAMPYAQQCNSLAFDTSSRTLWAATGQGWISIDANARKVIRTADWDKKVQDVRPLGSRTVAIIDSRICVAAPGTDTRRIQAFADVATLNDGISGKPSVLMPLTESHFAYVSSNGVIYLASLDDNSGTWKRTQLANMSGCTETDVTKIVATNLDHTCLQTRDGWYVATASKACFISRGADASSAPSAKTVNLPSGLRFYSSSWDGSSFWLYKHPGKIVNYDYDGSAWSACKSETRPDCPLMAGDMYFLHSPKHGLISMNYEGGNQIGNNSQRFGPSPALYKDGKWRNICSLYNPPYIADGNVVLTNNLYTSSVFRFPVSDPVGISIDPVNPDIVHVGSYWDGTASINMEDPRRMPVICSTTGNFHREWPFFNAFWAGTWAANSTMRVLGTDDEDNLWFMRSANYEPNSNESSYWLYWWTPEARRQALEESDPSKCGEWNSIRVDIGYQPGYYCYGYMCMHPANKGKFIMMPNEANRTYDRRRLIIYDTRNTPADTSDDTLVWGDQWLLEPDGGTDKLHYANSFTEDPVTGEIYIFTTYETYVIDPSRPLDGNRIRVRTLALPSDEGRTKALSPLPASAGCIDPYGRLWIASSTSGVIGLSADRKKVIAHYHTGNSPLPDDVVRGIGWNPETESLFVSTLLGIVEIKVDDAMQAVGNSPAAMRAFPETVTGNFTGTVAIHNVPPHAVLAVTDRDGRMVAPLPAPESGTTHWDLTDSEGRLVPTGTYRIGDVLDQADVRQITITVNR